MAKEMYVGINDVARKITNAYVGINGVARKIVKGYVGVNDIAHLIFEVNSAIPFTSLVTPTSWTVSGNNGTGTTTYGIWEINADTNPSAYTVDRAFDNNENSFVRFAARSTPTITLTLPSGISICPNQLYFKLTGASIGNTAFSGYNSQTSNWEQLITGFATTGGTFNITPANYYTKFKLYVPGNTTRVAPTVYEIQIQSGTLKDER